VTSERVLFERILADLAAAPGLGLFNLYHRDMELIRGLFDIAHQCQREIVFEPKTAYVVMRMLDRYPAIIIPDNRQYERPLPTYLEEVRQKAARVVTTEEVHAAPEKFFIQNSYENILELFDWPARSARYYHLYGVPLVEGGRDYANMMRVLNMTGTHYAAFADLYCYNHAYPNNLLFMADKIKAKNLVPVHSSNPEKLESQYSRQVLPRKGVAYTLQDGLLEPSDRPL
jgi:ribonuclease J